MLAQGFASGDLERDAAAIRLFADAGLELLLAQVLPMSSLRPADARLGNLPFFTDSSLTRMSQSCPGVTLGGAVHLC